jgi:hypothetical protein
MSGYLLQLARRGLGLSHGVRSRAALPYAASAATTRTATDDFAYGLDAEPSPDPGTDLAQADNTSNPHTQRTAPLSQVHSRPPADESSLANASSPAPTRGATSRGLHDVQQQTPQVKTDTPGPAALQLTHDRDVLPRPPDDMHSTHPADTNGKGAATASTPSATPPASARQTPPARTGTRTQLDTLIDRLVTPAPQPAPVETPAAPTPRDNITPARPLPEHATLMPPRPAASVERMAASPHARNAAEAPDPSPEVHITIGRLEINSPSRPAPPPSPRPRGPAPLSLGDYLARRQGGKP